MVSLSQIAKNEVSKETITQHDGAKEFLDKCYKNNHKQVYNILAFNSVCQYINKTKTIFYSFSQFSILC